MKTGKLRIPKRAMIFAASGKTTGNEITIRANSGREFPHPYWSKVAIDLSGMSIPKDRVPILMAHDQNRPIGAFRRQDAVVDADGLTVHGRLADVPAAREFANSVRNGIPFEASIYSVPSRIEKVEEGEKSEVNGRGFEGPGSIFRSWNLREVSPVVFGADHRTSVDIYAFAGAETMVEVNLEALSEDNELANYLFSLSNGTHKLGSEDAISSEDEAEAQRIYDMTRR